LVLSAGFVNNHYVSGENSQATVTMMNRVWAQDNPVFRQMLATMMTPDATSEQLAWYNQPDIDRLLENQDQIGYS
jgi:hypothetical protein